VIHRDTIEPRAKGALASKPAQDLRSLRALTDQYVFTRRLRVCQEPRTRHTAAAGGRPTPSPLRFGAPEHGQVLPVREAGPDEIGVVDLELGGNTCNGLVLGQRNRRVEAATANRHSSRWSFCSGLAIVLNSRVTRKSSVPPKSWFWLLAICTTMTACSSGRPPAP